MPVSSVLMFAEILLGLIISQMAAPGSPAVIYACPFTASARNVSISVDGEQASNAVDTLTYPPPEYVHEIGVGVARIPPVVLANGQVIVLHRFKRSKVTV